MSSPETPCLVLGSESTLSSLIWPSHYLPVRFCPLPWIRFSIHCLLRLLEPSSCPLPKRQHSICLADHPIATSQHHACMNEWMNEWLLAKSCPEMEFGEAHSFTHLLTGVLRKEHQWLYKILWLDNWKQGDGLFFFGKALRHVNPGLWTFCSAPALGSCAVFSAKASPRMWMSIFVLFHFSLYTFMLSFTAGTNNPASPVHRTKNTDASLCLRAPSPCQDCDRHFSGPPNKKAPDLTLQVKE